jgi:hypothetical protein
MPQTLQQKYRLTPGAVIGVINRPHGLPEYPADVTIVESLQGPLDQIHAFAKTRAELESIALPSINALALDGLLWVHYPKGTSGVQTDLTRDKGWDVFKNTVMQLVNLISVDDTWSAFGMKKRPTVVKRTPHKRSAESTSSWGRFIDKENRVVKAPPDLQKALSKKGKAKALFDRLAYSHKREYVEWILEAKREETRKRRVEQTVAKLAAGMKNPSAKR